MTLPWGDGLVTPLAPSDDLPPRLNSPFDVGTPHPLVQRALDVVMQQLRSGYIAGGLTTDVLRGPDGGKMFGVLVVQLPDGTLGFLKAFSGQLWPRWDVPGFVPPVFDRDLRVELERPGERVVKALTARVEAAKADPLLAELIEDERRLTAAHAELLAQMKAGHDARRALRRAARATATDEERYRLDRESQADDQKSKAARREWREEREALAALRARVDSRLAALERLRRIASQEVSRQIYDTYVFENAKGQRRSLRALFEPKLPSSGTGDCAAPKLLVFAQRHRLRPLGIAEFWWGAPPSGGGRTEGSLFPACKEKCAPVLSFLLEGVDVAPSRRHRPRDVAADELKRVFEDEHLVVFDKPEGLLSVPGTDATVIDSVFARVRTAFPNATGPLLVHRLDLETSGLLAVALDEATYVAMQKQFIERTIEKQYVAVLEGVIEKDAGEISLPLRVDLEQRPRQLVDFEHGKPATTRFSVLERANGRTRIALFPLTGRTHQLRVHCAHAQGLSTPIVGDRLYGKPGVRLLLHAERLSFLHPVTGVRVSLESRAPF